MLHISREGPNVHPWMGMLELQNVLSAWRESRPCWWRWCYYSVSIWQIKRPLIRNRMNEKISTPVRPELFPAPGGGVLRILWCVYWSILYSSGSFLSGRMGHTWTTPVPVPRHPRHPLCPLELHVHSQGQGNSCTWGRGLWHSIPFGLENKKPQVLDYSATNFPSGCGQAI